MEENKVKRKYRRKKPLTFDRKRYLKLSKQWSISIQQKLKDLKESGMSYAKIGKELGVSDETIRTIILNTGNTQTSYIPWEMVKYIEYWADWLIRHPVKKRKRNRKVVYLNEDEEVAENN